MTEQQNCDSILIDRAKFIKLLNKQCRLECMLALLSAICYAAKIKYLLTPEDVCDILGLDQTEFLKVLRKNPPKSTYWKGGRVFSLESMATIAESTTRAKRLEKLSQHIK